jgi:vacuolar-type H+-ATPase subunit H
VGLNRAEFDKHFKRISESHKRDESDYTPSGRLKIGKIGIGFIAANEICDIMEIVSTKAGSTELLEVSINFNLMRQDPILRKRADNEFAKADYTGSVSETDADSHFTQIFLKEIRGEAQTILAGIGNGFTSGERSLYGLKAESVCNRLQAKSLNTWSDFDAYSKNRLEIALNVPIPYHDGWLPSKLKKKLSDVEERVKNLNFSLYFDGSEIRKPIVFNPTGTTLISRFEFEGDHVAAKGYFYAQHGIIKPQELQGLLIRIRNAAVGDYDKNFLSFSPSIGRLFQSWISSEIMADDRLEDAMNIDRRTLRDAHPAYVELQQAIHKHLESFIKQIRDDIYGVGSQARNTEKAKKIEEKIINVAFQEIGKITPAAAQQVREAWIDTSDNENLQKKLLRKFTVDELYQLVIETAEEILSPKQLDDFLTRLTERIQR